MLIPPYLKKQACFLKFKSKCNYWVSLIVNDIFLNVFTITLVTDFAVQSPFVVGCNNLFLFFFVFFNTFTGVERCFFLSLFQFAKISIVVDVCFQHQSLKTTSPHLRLCFDFEFIQICLFLNSTFFNFSSVLSLATTCGLFSQFFIVNIY